VLLWGMHCLAHLDPACANPPASGGCRPVMQLHYGRRHHSRYELWVHGCQVTVQDYVAVFSSSYVAVFCTMACLDIAEQLFHVRVRRLCRNFSRGSLLFAE
jgi:hypothetical protein